MKTCPTCGNSYGDDLSFCLQDGTRLSGGTTFDLINSPTEVYRPDTNKNTDISTAETIVSGSNAISPPPKLFQMSAIEPSKRMGCVLTIGQVAAGLLLAVGLGLVGVFYTFRGNSEIARVETPVSNKPITISTNSAANTMANAANTSSTAHNSFANAGNMAANANNPMPVPKPKNSPKTIAGGVLNGKAIDLPEPSYPPVARAARASGSVSVQVLIDETGRVVSASAVSGHPLLRNAAVAAARSARFSPTLLGGESVKVSGVINYTFVP